LSRKILRGKALLPKAAKLVVEAAAAIASLLLQILQSPLKVRDLGQNPVVQKAQIVQNQNRIKSASKVVS
jgi:hypothetical protein